MLTRAEIKGFKCLRDVSVELGPFNVLIGPNDSGKSSFLQALREPQTLERMPHLGPGERSIRLWTNHTDILVKWSPVGWEFSRDGHPPSNHPSSPWPTEAFSRVSEPLMLEPAAVAELSLRGTGELARLISSRGRGAAAHLARVALGDRARYDAIQKGMHDITGGRIREAIVGEDTGQGYPLSFRLFDGTVIPARDVLQGLLVYFAFLTIVHRDDAPAVLLVEEPENGVHPLRLHEIVALLRSLSERGVQLIVTTHSPDLLNACKPEEVLVFRRPNPDSGTEIHRLRPDFKRRSMGSSLGEIWASSGEEGLLEILPEVQPQIVAEPS